MNHHLRRIFLLGAASLAATLLAGSAPAPVTPTAAPIAHEIDVLLKNRLRPEPLPLDLPNPFIPPGNARDGMFVQSGASTENAAPANNANPNEVARAPTSAEVLADCASRLRFGGLMRTKDHVQLVINDLPRKEGDLITVPWGAAPIQIAIAQILPEQVLLRYNDVELSVRY